MHCPYCKSTVVRKNGKRRGKLWAHLCKLWSSIYTGLTQKLPDAPPNEEIPEVGELDELETFVGSKKIKFGYGQQ